MGYLKAQGNALAAEMPSAAQQNLAASGRHVCSGQDSAFHRASVNRTHQAHCPVFLESRLRFAS